jgi:hypothetical protein
LANDFSLAHRIFNNQNCGHGKLSGVNLEFRI